MARNTQRVYWRAMINVAVSSETARRRHVSEDGDGRDGVGEFLRDAGEDSPQHIPSSIEKALADLVGWLLNRPWQEPAAGD